MFPIGRRPGGTDDPGASLSCDIGKERSRPRREMKETNQPNSHSESGRSAGPPATGADRPGAAMPPFATSSAAPPAANGAGLKPPKSRKPRKSAQAAKPRGRLDREVLAKIGKGLKESFEDVRRQEVPERFKALLRQF
jgi:Anti-sigma factor NepR